MNRYGSKVFDGEIMGIFDRDDGLSEEEREQQQIKKFLEEYEDSWTIKDNKIQFTNLNKMTEYYSLLNQLID